MKIEVKKWTPKKNEFKLSIKINPKTEESQLFEKYDFTKENIRVFEEKPEKIYGTQYTNFKSLCKGEEWNAYGGLYRDFAQIPEKIQNGLRELFDILNARETWNADEILEI